MTWPLSLSALLAAIILTGCQSTGEGPSQPASAAAFALADGLAEAVGRCWFADTEDAFAGYVYTPETVGGRPRILLAARDDPGGLPALVIEPRSGGEVDVYGPLIASELGPRIDADIDRWRSGGTACGS